MKYLFSLFTLQILFFISCKSVSEEQFESSSNEVITKKEKPLFHSVICKDSLVITFQKHDSLSISFHRQHKDSAWSSISFGRWPHKVFDKTDTINLSSYVKQIDTCWNYVSELGVINIKSLGLLAPQHYPDILKNQINAFNNDELWKSKTTNNKISNNEVFDWVPSLNWSGNIMMNNDVYKPINDFLKQKGFKISWYALEKLIEIPESKQNELGVDSVILIPSALAINVSVSKFIDEIGERLPAPDSSSYDQEYYYSIFDYVRDNFKETGQKTAAKKAIFKGEDVDEYLSAYVDVEDNNPKARTCAWHTRYEKNVIYEENSCEGGREAQSILFVNYSFEEVMSIMKILKPREFYDYFGERKLAEGWRYTGNNSAEYVMQLDCWLTVKGTDTIRVEFACAVCNA